MSKVSQIESFFLSKDVVFFFILREKQASFCFSGLNGLEVCVKIKPYWAINRLVLLKLAHPAPCIVVLHDISAEFIGVLAPLYFLDFRDRGEVEKKFAQALPRGYLGC